MRIESNGICLESKALAFNLSSLEFRQLKATCADLNKLKLRSTSYSSVLLSIFNVFSLKKLAFP